ncbi:hypothetical protein DITRI_Ditri20bG0043700 [Diplodiscus trichospermus]
MANNFLERTPFKPPFEIIGRKTETINVKYKECKRNQAPHLGVNFVDGCGEFAPKKRSSATGSDDDDLDCEACGCHRNFHRRELTKKLSLTFIENEEACLFRFPPRASQLNNAQKPSENDELNGKTKEI